MLSLPLTLTLALAQPAPQAQLLLEPGPGGQLSVALCFQGQGQRIDYRLSVAPLGSARGNRTNQQGTVTTRPERQCPIRSRTSLPADGQVEVQLHWSIDGTPQPSIRRLYPEGELAARPADDDAAV